jgi:hypothetical protein
VAIPKPKGEAGDKKNGFNLRTAMQLGDAEQKDLYDAIQVSDLKLSISGNIVLFDSLYVTSIDFGVFPFRV